MPELKVKLRFKQVEVELTLEEARGLLETLRDALETPRVEIVPWPTYYPPVYYPWWSRQWDTNGTVYINYSGMTDG